MCMLRQDKPWLTDPTTSHEKNGWKFWSNMHARYHFYFWKFAQWGENIFGGAFLYMMSPLYYYLFFILNYFTDVSLTSFGFIFVQKRIFVIILKKRMWTSKIIKWCWKYFFIRWTLVRCSFRKYFTILWCTTLPSNGTAAWLMDKTETIQGKSGPEIYI